MKYKQPWVGCVSSVPLPYSEQFLVGLGLGILFRPRPEINETYVRRAYVKDSFCINNGY